MEDGICHFLKRPTGKILLAAAAFFVCVAAFSPLLRAPLLYDDHSLIGKDPFISSLAAGTASSAEIFDGLWFRPRPVRQLSHRLDAVLFGPSIAAPHAENIVFHLVAGLLFGALLRKIGVQAEFSFAAAFLFVLHPVCVESIGILSHRKELLSCIWLLAALRSSLSNGIGVRILAIPCLFLAIFSKETAMVFPMLWLLAEWERTRSPEAPAHIRRLLWLRFAAWSLVSVAFGTLALLQIRHGMAVLNAAPALDPDRAGHFSANAPWTFVCSAAARAFPRFLAGYLAPWGHTIDPDFDLGVRFRSSATLIAAMVWMAFGICLVVLWRRRSRFFAPLAWIPVSLSPYLFPPLLRNGGIGVCCDRYAYLASMGFAWTLAYAISAIMSRIRAKICRTMALLAVPALLVSATFATARSYMSAESFWGRCTRLNPNSFQSRFNHAWALWKEVGDTDGARLEFERMARERPSFSFGMCGYADFLIAGNALDLALDVVDHALEIRPGRRDLLVKRAFVLLRAERFAEATDSFSGAAAAGADSAQLQFGWAEACKRCLRWPEALKHYRLAAKMDPSFREAAVRHEYLVRDPGPAAGKRGIVVVGDSVPHGMDALDDEGQEHSLAERIALRIPGIPFLDRTIPDSQARQLRESMPTTFGTKGLSPRWCIIMTGHNDAFFGRTPDEILFELSGCAFAARIAGMKPLMIGPIHVASCEFRNRERQEATLAHLDRAMSSFCKSANIAFISSRKILGSRNPSLDSWLQPGSGNHLNDEALDILADACATVIGK